MTMHIPPSVSAAVIALLLLPVGARLQLFLEVCDAVSHAHRYEPELNPTYRELARHYGVAVIPARAARPRDMAHAS